MFELDMYNSLAEEKILFEDIDSILAKKKFQFVLKRLFDIICSFTGLLLLIPIFVIISVLIKVDSRGEILFRQARVGKNSKEFKILKFRTMVVGAEKQGMQITVGNDNRITRLGCFLRNTKLDELPQLLNVIIGNMSLVGPRPEVPKYVALYNSRQNDVLKVKPGITDIASIYFKNENEILANVIEPEKVYIEQILPLKIELNRQYINNINLLTDIKIIILTIYAIISRKEPTIPDKNISC